MKLLFQNFLFQSPLVNLFNLTTIFISLHCGNAVNLPNNETIPALIVFGDSIVDSGNNNYIDTYVKCNFLPYGRDFGGGNQPTGRFSNGVVPSDIIGTKIILLCSLCYKTVLNCGCSYYYTETFIFHENATDSIKVEVVMPLWIPQISQYASAIAIADHNLKHNRNELWFQNGPQLQLQTAIYM